MEYMEGFSVLSTDKTVLQAQNRYKYFFHHYHSVISWRLSCKTNIRRKKDVTFLWVKSF